MTDDTTKVIEVTKEGLEELKTELQELEEIKLPEVVERVARAREFGDLSENSEYHSAREDQQLIQTRIDEIQEVIANAKVVRSSKSKDKVTIGSHVEVKEGRKTHSLHIVGEFEADGTGDKISATSPVGKALLGKKKGDTILVNTPGGEKKLEITTIN
ncbi:MAG: transcription elongation factor GreA [Pseudomonadales bacterium]|nr:transcription elongation factor GreA [Candidatus Woesebacteria bacterium]MCB9802069.1 transcription elongation factor GreA [Pseudomonadales bacterium]